MDPYYEQRLRDEVLYLHSLWHNGPPGRANPNPLQPSNSTQFKKERKTPRGRRGRKGKNRPLGSHPRPVSDIEWPCKPPEENPPATSSGWPVLNLPSTSATRLPSAEEQARFTANQVQQKAFKAAQEFFARNAGSDGDASDEDGEEDDDMMDEDGFEEYNFFVKVFTEDSELRGYYEKNYEGGEFSCLVCGGVGKKVGKRFKDCVALVQHSTSIAKKRRAHRAYGQAICKVLGWEIDRLPTIVLSLGDRLSCALSKSGESQGTANEGGKDDSNVFRNNVDSVNAEIVEAVPKMYSNASEVLPDKAVDLSNAMDGELIVCENSLTVADANKSTEDLDKGLSNLAEGNAEGVNSLMVADANKSMEDLGKGLSNLAEGIAEGVVNSIEPLKEDGVGSGGNEVKDDQKDNVVLDGVKEDNKYQN